MAFELGTIKEVTATPTAQTINELSQRWKQMLPQKWLRIVSVPWTLVLIGGSLMSASAKDSIGTHDYHRAFHFGAFGSTAALYMLLVKTAAGEFGAALAATGLGLSLEALQFWIYDGVMEWWDVRDDAIGIGVALFVFRAISRVAR